MLTEVLVPCQGVQLVFCLVITLASDSGKRKQIYPTDLQWEGLPNAAFIWSC